MTNVNAKSFEVDKCRIFICDEQDRARSRCWYFQSTGRQVYIGPDVTGGTSKLSFHVNDGSSRDGCDSQWGLTRTYAEMEIRSDKRVPRPVRWKRPATPSVGVVQVASILFPTDFLRGRIPPFQPCRKRIALPLAPPGHAIEIGVFYSRDEPSAAKTNLNKAGGTSLGYFSLPDGENVVIAAREVPFKPEAIPQLYEWGRIGYALSGAPEVGTSIDNCGATMLHHKPMDGEIATLAEINGLTIGSESESIINASI